MEPHNRGRWPTQASIDRSEHELAEWEVLTDAIVGALGSMEFNARLDVSDRHPALRRRRSPGDRRQPSSIGRRRIFGD